jgi:hypothetical protein
MPPSGHQVSPTSIAEVQTFSVRKALDIHALQLAVAIPIGQKEQMTRIKFNATQKT